MSNTYFQFKQFIVHQDQCAMKVSTEACILGAWVKGDKPNRILDIGTGTGLLALMLAQRYDCPIDAVEIDAHAAEQAKQNVRSSPRHDRMSVCREDIRDFAKASNHRYDLIVCNPPFFQGSLKSSTATNNMAKHESDVFDKAILIQVLKELLSETGQAFVIYPEEESRLFHQGVKDEGLFIKDALLIRNQPHAAVFRIISEVSRQEISTSSIDLLIRKGHAYSPEMKVLLEAYYLES